MFIAISREVSLCITECELTHLARTSIDLERARAQHRQYEELLVKLGCELIRLPVEPELPDSVFVEDAAIVLDELAVITRPGAESRRAEISSIADVLKQYRKLFHIKPPGTLDGGDVLRVNKTLYVGLSARSNPEGIEQLRSILAPFGYSVTAVELHDCLHLKSAVTQVADNTLLINRAWADARVFDSHKLIEVDPSEPFAANSLLVGNTVIYPAAFPKTRKRLEARGINMRTVDASELAKAEGGVTCCSLIFSEASSSA
ncbi:MAG: dimethylargininase [Gammaproteobacteria bacterium]|nr:dimethylargininase [Gammaproteobacteria bacterium]MBU6509399.1 dimethylargininase [Gammaproteobacteria bacterium]MDE1983793.1 dimethylargininase [Gammaproteobacteria bacterium]MDE2107770.1 dimethylargininase [Gammaproteobacteria bacterium]MDE2460736.1 dimethylargininase [Gammaproteobacteria bacterium]